MAEANYQKLIVWQKAMDLVENVYRASRKLPKEEIYCLTSQMRRSAISIPSNIAEGQGRRTTRDFQNFLSIALGSLKELETQILIAARLNYWDQATTTSLCGLTERVGQLLNGLLKSLNRKNT
ncbi:MAG: four helix bundle protein [Pirellulales bacterium]|nr:four helix bundle protein [Pirellulales bacterium]